MKRKILTIIPIFIFSTMLWAFISLSQDHFTTATFKVKIIDAPKGYSVAFVSNEYVTLNVKGKGWLLTQISDTENKFFYVSADSDSGTIRKDLRSELSKNHLISSSLEITEVNPTNLTFTIEKTISKTVPVVLNVRFRFQENFGRVSEFTIEPDNIKVSGPVSLIKKLKQAETAPEIYTDIDKNFSEKIPILKNPYLNYENDYALVSFEAQRLVERKFADIPVAAVGTPPNRKLQLFPDKVDLLIKGGIDVLAQLDKKKLLPYVYFSQAINDTLGYVQPSIDLPQFMRLIDITPDKLKYIIKQYGK